MRWIVVDGIDGSGKSTVALWIKNHYSSRGERVLIRIHPSNSWLGRKSRKALEGNGKVMGLIATTFFILDVLRSLKCLKKDRKKYDTIIFVRYLMATAYLPKKLAPKGYDFFSKLLPIPPRLLLVDVDPETANQRIHERGESKEMFEDVASLNKVREKILFLALRGQWRIIDNTRSEECVKNTLTLTLEEWDSVF
ncbi:MAG: hypothetical protein QW520_06640 [Methanomassiliicoccales archaeon]